MATNLGDEEEELLGYRPPAMTVNLDDSDDDDDDDGDSDGMSSDDDNPTPGERLTNRRACARLYAARTSIAAPVLL